MLVAVFLNYQNHPLTFGGESVTVGIVIGTKEVTTNISTSIKLRVIQLDSVLARVCAGAD